MARLALAVLVLLAAGCSDRRAKPPQPRTLHGATLSSLIGLDVAPDGSWVVADDAAGQVVRIDPSGRTRVLARVTAPSDVAVNDYGTVYVSEWHPNRVSRIENGGTVTVARVQEPQALALDGHGGLYVTSVNTVRRVDLGTGRMAKVAGTGAMGADGDGGPATKARLWAPHGVAVDRDGNLVIGHWTRIRRLDTKTGTIERLAGTGGFAQRTVMPVHLVVDRKGRIFFCDVQRRSVRMLDDGKVTTVFDGAARGLDPYDVALAGDDGLLVGDHGARILHVDLDDGTVRDALRR